MPSHISDDSLERYSMGGLTGAEIAPLEEHLLVCEECRKRLVSTDVEIAAIREALKRREEKPEE
jgi:hypothetical protein